MGRAIQGFRGRVRSVDVSVVVPTGPITGRQSPVRAVGRELFRGRTAEQMIGQGGPASLPGQIDAARLRPFIEIEKIETVLKDKQAQIGTAELQTGDDTRK